MNTFSKTALFSVAMLVSGSVFAMENVNDAGLSFKSTFSFLKIAASERLAAGLRATQDAARSVWTPSFVQDKKDFVGSLDQAQFGQDVSRSRRRFAYRAALVSAVALPAVLFVYKKYGNAIAAKFASAQKSAKKAFNAKKKAFKLA